MKYLDKALDKIWRVIQEIEESRQIDGNDTYVRLPYYPKNPSPDSNKFFEAKKGALENFQRQGAISNLHKAKAKRGAKYYVYWAFSIGKNYKKVFNDFQEQHTKINDPADSAKKGEVGESLSYRCGHIKLNLKQATLQYKNGKAIDISPRSQEIRLLELLLQEDGFVTFEEISEKIDSTSYSGEGVSRAVGYIKRELRKILLNAGMTPKEFTNKLLVKRKYGYKINCP